MPEIRAVAAPVKNAGGQIIAALSVTYPSFNQNHIELRELLSRVLETSEEISRAYTAQKAEDQPTAHTSFSEERNQLRLSIPRSFWEARRATTCLW